MGENIKLGTAEKGNGTRMLGGKDTSHLQAPGMRGKRECLGGAGWLRARPRARGLADQNWDLPGASLYKQRGSGGSQWPRALRERAFIETRELRTFSWVGWLQGQNATSLRGCGLPQDRSRRAPPTALGQHSYDRSSEGGQREEQLTGLPTTAALTRVV